MLARAITARTQLIGGVSLELLGHLQEAFQDHTIFFDYAVDLLADLVGLSIPTSGGVTGE